ncbi:chromosome partitioning protein ParA [Erwinia sp. OLTSP20]|uniref:ParA family protein n=1 Tax=unclassified Erwinia TaxID=2622719 RepID=UPI000C183F2A|nr:MULTISPECIES: ParA family protein [unclassified Erwinia]PIJ52131.1 chromosome partitioning protein ParA [Erwinia sp. OAMSP11]PIJ73151.1 chromosome partitioning protein ParA [Erwinia sp. OLSSP12]PIJ84660.1 chromosome partitioning protein ParA [Erwinia sp. OLCASP19]PIJ87307.1 chromosome partitioning protein ParA [Erwinia sp. OLMTSP26]PIJ87538.1 chromosome partitioning protein ParA [Erwinia sp. OLMDSP33]
MPVIVFVSPKGGAGKTTSALALAMQIALRVPVTAIDADPNHPIKTWSEGGDVPQNMTIISDVTDKTIGETIAEAAAKTPFVIVDLEGTAATIVAYAIAEADFVIVPTQGSQLDAEQASRAFGLIRAHERGIQKHKPDYKLPYAVLFTRTSAAIQSRDTKHIRESFKAGGIPFFETELNERAAFKAMFSYRQLLETLPRDEVSNVDKAIENAEAFTRELITRITPVATQQQDKVTL